MQVFLHVYWRKERFALVPFQRPGISTRIQTHRLCGVSHLKGRVGRFHVEACALLGPRKGVGGSARRTATSAVADWLTWLGRARHARGSNRREHGGGPWLRCEEVRQLGGQRRVPVCYRNRVEGSDLKSTAAKSASGPGRLLARRSAVSGPQRLHGLPIFSKARFGDCRNLGWEIRMRRRWPGRAARVLRRGSRASGETP